MADVLDQARKAIEGRLREVEDEAQRLRDALAGLGGDRRPAPRRRASQRAATRPRSRGAGKRAPRGQRQSQFLAVLGKSPGAKVPEIAKEMGVSASQVYGLAGRLHRSGKIRKQRGGGYALKS